MKKLALLSLILATSLTACIDIDQPEPQNNNGGNNSGGNNGGGCETGTVTFVNNSANPYDVFVDGSKLFQQPGNSRSDKSLTKGSHAIKVQQVSGYLVYPTVQEYNVSLDGCDTKTVSYP